MSAAPDPLAFVSLADYHRPVGESAGAWKRIGEDLRKRLGLGADATVAAFDDLERLSADTVRALTPEPSYGTFKSDLDTHVSDWLGDADAPSVMLIVYPPASRERFLSEWGESRGLAVRSCRDALAEPDWIDGTRAIIQAEGAVVVPDIHNAFLRRFGGLDLIAHLLAAISGSPHKVVVGCNSWAWTFLEKAVDADHFLPAPIAPQAVDAAHLRDWFREATRDCGFVFHSLATGGDVFADADPFFDDLAISSLGTPWSAWSLWRESLYHRQSDNSQAIWVRLPDKVAIPSSERRRALFILHALLIHGGLAPDALSEVLPSNVPQSLVALLTRTGIVSLEEGRLDVTPRAYPAVRAALANAGFPLGAL